MRLRKMGKDIADFQMLVESDDREEFKSPLRSTVPHLAFWRNLKQRIALLCSLLSLEKPDDFTTEFEFQVHPPRGRGKSSHTDLMLTWTDHCVAIEAKYTEQPYDDVNAWLAKGEDATNRLQVLQGWCDLIEGVTGVRLLPEDIRDLPYQMLHRVASACDPPAKNRLVVYIGFDLSPDQQEYYRKGLARLYHLLGCPSVLRFAAINIPIVASEKYRQLVSRWNSGERDLSREVVQGLLDGSLMDFGEPTVFYLG